MHQFYASTNIKIPYHLSQSVLVALAIAKKAILINWKNNQSLNFTHWLNLLAEHVIGEYISNCLLGGLGFFLAQWPSVLVGSGSATGCGAGDGCSALLVLPGPFPVFLACCGWGGSWWALCVWHLLCFCTLGGSQHIPYTLSYTLIWLGCSVVTFFPIWTPCLWRSTRKFSNNPNGG